MAYISFMSYDAELEDLPFPIPRDLHVSGLVSNNVLETIDNAEEFIALRDYRTAAALLTLALQQLDERDPQLMAALYCRRAECLLNMHYLQHVMRDCRVAQTKLGGLDEHIAFLFLRSLELQGEVEEAFGYAIIYKALDAKMERDKDAVHRLKAKVMWLCGQDSSSPHYISRTINILMLRGEILQSSGSAALAVKIYTELLILFPGFLEAHEQRAQCFFILGDYRRANQDCNRALNLSLRTSTLAFKTKIEIQIQFEELDEALELVDEWRMIDPENLGIDHVEMQIKCKMREKKRLTSMRQAQSMLDLSVGQDQGDQNERQPRVKRKPIRASKQISGAKHKTKKEQKREEHLREKERQKIAQELEAKQTEKEGKIRKDIISVPKEEQRTAKGEMAGGNQATPEASTLLPLGPCFEQRSRKRKVRRKTRNLRAKREGLDDDSDASSVCSISTCPDDLVRRRDTHHRPRMPIFSDTETGNVNYSTKSTSAQKSVKKFRPRPTGFQGKYRLCRYHTSKQRCFQGERCPYPHSEEERKAWEEERNKGFSKPSTKQNTTKQTNESGSASLVKELRQALEGRCRPPLRTPGEGGKYKMCPEWRKGTCKLGIGCTFAHGEEELTAWNEQLEKMKKDERKKKEKENDEQREDEFKVESKVSNADEDEDEVHPVPVYKLEDLVSSLSGVDVSCEPKELNVSLQIPLDSQEELSYKWTVKICYESSKTGHLHHVALLPQYHKCYTLSSVRLKCTIPTPNGPPMELKSPDNESLRNKFHYAVKSYMCSLHGHSEVEVTVSFSTSVFGSFAEALVFDFGKESACLAVKMNIEVGSQEFLQEFDEEKSKLALDCTLWDDGSREIVKFEPQKPSVFKNDHLINRYKLPKAEDIIPCPLLDKSQGLNPKNYMNVMHQLLFVEEFYIRKQIASFNAQKIKLHASKLIVKKHEVLCAQEGWLYGSFHVARPITPDDAQGRLLLRNLFSGLGSVLIARSQKDSFAYEAFVDSVEDSRVIIKLSDRCCKELELSHNTFVTVDLQFHINRLPLCEMHDNIDRLGPEHFRILFPELSSTGSEEKIRNLKWILDVNVNEHQREIIKKVAAPAIDAPPLVVFGPFGTGKTYTLSQAIRRISVNQNNRVLICTHSNSAADIHVELLHNYLKDPASITACKPLRIYTPLRKLSTVSVTVKEYCLISDKGTQAEAFRLPTRDDVLRHRVVISTLGMSRALFDMNLHRGYFSHILIDEAAQALETETITPLTLAGNKTKVVFTGDHMQMSPDVFSPQAKKWGFQISLQERLFYDYKRRQSGSEIDPNLIFLTENYRSNERLLQFSSDMFYGGDLSSGSEQPLHPQFGPLVFYAALGKEEIEENHASYRNLAEVNEVVKRVKELSHCWPEEWGTRDLQQIAVVSSYRYQVKTIRDGLRKVGLGAVDVETIENIQGKQFRALFVSTVRTFHTCKEPVDSGSDESESPYLYFLSDPKLLNTALTRAQSLIAVVGDPFSLRTVGDCQGLWEEFIKRCNDDGKLFGIRPKELEESISQCGLNVNASEFVPKVTADSRQLLTDPSGSDSSLPPQENKLNEKTREKNSFHEGSLVDKVDFSDTMKLPVSEESYSAEESETGSASYSDDAGDEFSEIDDFGNADDFAEYENVDETVPPKCMDPIIKALKEKCEQNKTKRKLKEEKRFEEITRKVGVNDVAEPRKVNVNLNLSQTINKENTESDLNTTEKKIVHEDVKMKTKKGKTQIFLVNLNYKYSERTERLCHQPKVKDQECLQPEYLDRFLKEEPKLYRECTLRVNYEGTRTSYGELQDPESEDILIEGNTRQSFNRDVVVVKLSEKPSLKVEDSSEILKGQIMGIRHHAINFRERQFVCRVSRDNPRVMYPINKSVTPIVNLNDERCKGVPIYRMIQAGSHEKTVRVDTLSLKDAQSDKFLFVVQYLQWKRDFPYPLGIVTKAVRKADNLIDSFKLLNAEYNVNEEFPEWVTKEAERNTERWSNIVANERKSRPFVQNAFTIDPPGSRDLDDALTVEELPNGLYKVGIHVADVSSYVPPGSRIDAEAKRRGTSYFRGHRRGEVLMLPEALSYDICSLLPNQERLAVSVYVVLDQEGSIQEENELDLCRSIVKSRCRLTYAQAQKIILQEPVSCKPQDGELTPEIEESIGRLNFLAQRRRNFRLFDGAYFHFDHADRQEDLEAHELVEEMMILANCVVARHLVERKPEVSPLRIQRRPKTRKLAEWRERFGRSAKLSLSLRRHLTSPEDVECEETFVLPTSTWSRIVAAHRKQDQRELNLLVCNDNMYPQLAVAQSSLRSVNRKAEDVIAAEVPADDRFHWSLNVEEYTRFTSPIRRYLDIVVHRLLFETARQDEMVDDIANVYRRCSFLSDNSSKFEKDCGRVEAAFKLVKASCKVNAVVEMIADDHIRLQLLADVNQFLSPKQRRIQISHLGPIKQPTFQKSSTCLELKWKLRIYDASPRNIKRAKNIGRDHQDRHLREDWARLRALLSIESGDSGSGHKIPGTLWMAILDAVKEKAFETLGRRIEDVDDLITVERGRQQEEESITNIFFEEVEEEAKEDGDSDDDKLNDADEEDDDEFDDYDDDEEEEEEEEDEEEEEEEEEEEQEQEQEQEQDRDKTEEKKSLNEKNDTAMHFIDTSLVLKVADNVIVQLSATDAGGIMSPEIQLFHLTSGIDICLEHRRLPDKCFTATASEQASRPRYKSINTYIHAWTSVLDMEAATLSVRNDDTIILHNLVLKWRRDKGGKLIGEFQLNKVFCETRQIKIARGDYACVKVYFPTPCSSSLSNYEQLKRKGESNQGLAKDALGERVLSVTPANNFEYGSENDYGVKDGMSNSPVKSQWVSHCIFTLAKMPKMPTAVNSQMKCRLELFQSSTKVPESLGNGDSWICTLEIIKQPVPTRRMISNLMMLPEVEKSAGELLPLAHNICLGNAFRLPGLSIPLPSERLSIADHKRDCNLTKLNDFQVGAIRQSLRGRFTLIQGPPGTGKTITGVHIAYWFAQMNQENLDNGIFPPESPPQVLYCGPSNKSVDVVAEYLLRIPGIKILRVYGKVIEEEEFAIPNQVRQTRHTANYEVPESLKDVALHHVIRDKKKSPGFARKLKRFEIKFVRLKREKKKVSDKTVASYLKTIHQAELGVIKSMCEGQYHQIVLCTCSAAGSDRIKNGCNTIQCIVDESAMCLEPETIVPIASSEAKQVVLIGDHMQLQPIVANRVARSLGLKTSLFERYSEHALMLKEQYRMHEDICKFPSEQFYNSELKTADSVRRRERETTFSRNFVKFWPNHTGKDYVPLVFCNVAGKEEELVVTSEEGHERSKSNAKEKDKVVHVIKRLISCGVQRNQIVVLSPYRAQCYLIEEDLSKQGLSEIQVMSIVKSQGSESDFVIISLVRSLPDSQIDHEPSRGWLRENLGFVTDEHQINVALTRAKRGLCIIGNKNLLGVCEMWDSLIEHYRKKTCLVEGDSWPVPINTS